MIFIKRKIFLCLFELILLTGYSNGKEMKILANPLIKKVELINEIPSRIIKIPKAKNNHSNTVLIKESIDIFCSLCFMRYN